MRMLAALLLAFAVPNPAAAQDTATAEAAGTYDGSQTEIAAGLHLGEDGRFGYVLSYGALDERAQGTWRAEGEEIVLESDPMVAPAFDIVSQEAREDGVVILTLDAEDDALPYFSAFAFLPDGTKIEFHFEEGPLRLPQDPRARSVAVSFALPLFDIEGPKIDLPAGGSAIVARFSPNSLGQVPFAGERLRPVDGALVLDRHDRTLRFRKMSDSELSD